VPAGFPGRPGAHREQDTVLVEQQAGYGPHGYPVYADTDRTVRVEIEDTGLVDRPERDTPVHAQPLR
jgi:hypothetical protein